MTSRRGFLAALLVAPFVPKALPVHKEWGIVISGFGTAEPWECNSYVSQQDCDR